MHAGKWIVAAFVFFAGFIATLVTVCVRQDINLVSKDYYQQELKHQQKMDKVRNAKMLVQAPRFEAREGAVALIFPDRARMERGTLRLMRPSDPALDQVFEVASSANVSEPFVLPKWTRGLYRATLEWTMDGKEYFVEQMIVL
jgi:hypothetical protein